ncbi:MAG TPA: quinoprotein dehydrogenase-associated putative ABC transporter substrate-binding protein [Steroidobacteraceae bacterium]|jgi:quinoprotein dehydrogenase-associated probable ABC transporter substrate-binding protein
MFKTIGLAAVLIATGAFGQAGPQPAADHTLRVCADPDNLPLSNARGEGYENKIAEQLARDLGRQIEYTFFPQRMGFVRNTLRQKDAQTQQFKCDVIIGVPKGYELTATTRPYMHSTYALVFRHRPELESLQKADDLLKLPREQLRSLRIGVFGRSPGADWLLRNDLLDHAVMYSPQSGDPAENPAHTIERDLANETIDLAILWGPMAGFLVGNHSAFPAWRAVPFVPDREIRFDYEISMGVRFGEKEWKDTLDQWIASHEDSVRSILASFLVPLVDAEGKVTADFRAADRLRAEGVPKRIPLPVEPQP